MDLGPHAFYIVAAYVAAAIILCGLILWMVLDHRAQRRALAELEGRGVRRRSAGSEPLLVSGQAGAESEAATGRSG